MKRQKLTIATATAVAVPMLVGCGQGGQSAEASSPAASQTEAAAASSAPASSAATTPGGDAASSPAATTAPSASGAPGSGSTLPTVKDPCAGVCDETARVKVEHPAFGPMEIVAYTLTTVPDTAPQGKRPSYAVYQDGHAVGYASSPEKTTVVSFGPEPVIGDQMWGVNPKHPVDKYGNVYFSDSMGVTVISPTERGYDSHGTLPGSEKPGFPFQSAGAIIDPAGEPTVTQKVLGKDHVYTGETVKWTWNGSQFVVKK
ncbi:hypothetical protein [Kocuria rhizophila]|uniref:hypothetical protein n=1 Tax=Kocuria rhizophila TaxID=72000 RepID=UPI001D3DBB02|nr:hypothetical protein [Kocuria rhizophila]MCC5672294.1 hypothetical protein [Kocuria rhizophila]